MISVAITILPACSDLEMYTFEIPEGYITDTDTDDNLNSNDTSEDNEDTNNDNDETLDTEEDEEETYTVSDATDTDDNGYEYVDLGLSSGLKWATVNIGATLPADYGDYFAWGETEAKKSFYLKQ